MEWFERGPSVPRGGGAASRGGCYHLSFRSGSRAGGACAAAAHAYITRSEEYDDPERDPVVYTESVHMPDWAKDDPHEYWDAADLYERANGRLYVSADFALPRGLDTDEQVDLAHAFAQELTADERLPYTLAIHPGCSADGHEHNPPAHIMISERQNDGTPRSKEMWFRRANRAHPVRGGAAKSRTFHGREWMEHVRVRWAELTNKALERCGRTERVDHRSYERQGLDREPGHHYGPAAAHMVGRGLDHDRLNEAAGVAAREDAQRVIEQKTDPPTGGGRGAVTHDDEPSKRRRDRDSTVPDHTKGLFPQR